MRDKAETIMGIELSDLMRMEGLRGAEPSEIFGVNFDGDFNLLPAFAQSYAGIGAALEGQPLDLWARHGMHRAREPKFSNFMALTEGLSLEDRVRTVVILNQYLKDIAMRAHDFDLNSFERQTLVSAEIWVHDMLMEIDEETKTACREAGVLRSEVVEEKEPGPDLPNAAESVRSTSQSALVRWTRRVWGR